MWQGDTELTETLIHHLLPVSQSLQPACSGAFIISVSICLCALKARCDKQHQTSINQIDLHSYRGLLVQRKGEEYIVAADYAYSAWKYWYLNKNAAAVTLERSRQCDAAVVRKQYLLK